jgi:hypothetical protein
VPGDRVTRGRPARDVRGKSNRRASDRARPTRAEARMRDLPPSCPFGTSGRNDAPSIVRRPTTEYSRRAKCPVTRLGVLMRATWLDSEGHEGFLGLEGGVMTEGLPADTSGAGHPLTAVATVTGLGLSVPIANRSLATETSINLHAWFEYEVSRGVTGQAGSPSDWSLDRASRSETSARTSERRERRSPLLRSSPPRRLGRGFARHLGDRAVARHASRGSHRSARGRRRRRGTGRGRDPLRARRSALELRPAGAAAPLAAGPRTLDHAPPVLDEGVLRLDLGGDRAAVDAGSAGHEGAGLCHRTRPPAPASPNRSGRDPGRETVSQRAQVRPTRPNTRCFLGISDDSRVSDDCVTERHTAGYFAVLSDTKTRVARVSSCPPHAVLLVPHHGGLVQGRWTAPTPSGSRTETPARDTAAPHGEAKTEGSWQGCTEEVLADSS